MMYAPTGGPLPESLHVEERGDIAIVHIDRPHKRNALNDATILGLEWFFDTLSDDIKAVIFSPIGDNFSAGLDLSELSEVSTFDGIAHSRFWYRVFQKIEYGRVPVIAVLKGAVIGGGIELATTAHLRVAEPTAFYALPEGQRGLFVGGGGSVRLSKLIGANRVADLMLTGRRFSADEGQALGISNYLVDEGAGLDKAIELATAIAGNSPVTNYAIMHALPRIAQSGEPEGYLLEALMAAISQGSDEAKDLMRAFLDGSGVKIHNNTQEH